jgi:hypothetical protein
MATRRRAPSPSGHEPLAPLVRTCPTSPWINLVSSGETTCAGALLPILRDGSSCANPETQPSSRETLVPLRLVGRRPSRASGSSPELYWLGVEGWPRAGDGPRRRRRLEWRRLPQPVPSRQDDHWHELERTPATRSRRPGASTMKRDERKVVRRLHAGRPRRPPYLKVDALTGLLSR